MLDYFTNAYLHKIYDNWIKWFIMVWKITYSFVYSRVARITKYRSQNHNMEINGSISKSTKSEPWTVKWIPEYKQHMYTFSILSPWLTKMLVLQSLYVRHIHHLVKLSKSCLESGQYWITLSKRPHFVSILQRHI